MTAHDTAIIAILTVTAAALLIGICELSDYLHRRRNETADQ